MILFAGVAAATQIGKVPPAIPDIRAELALGMVGAGWVASIINLTSALFGIILGALADALGHARMLTAGLALIVIGSLVGASADAGSLLLFTRFLEGAGYVSITVAAPSLLLSATGGRGQRLVLGIWSGRFPAGIGAMLVISPLFLTPYGWRGLWYASAALLAVALALVAAAQRPRRAPGALTAPAPPRRIAELGSPLRSRGAWLLAGSLTMWNLQWLAIIAWLPTFLIESEGYTTAAAALVVALVVIAELPGNVLGGVLMHRGVPCWVLLALGTTTAGAAAIGIFSAAVPVGLKLVLALCFAFVGGLVPPGVMGAVPTHAPTPGLVGTIIGVVVQISSIGALTGPPLIAAAVVLLGGWHEASWLLLGAGAVGAVFALSIRSLELRMQT